MWARMDDARTAPTNPFAVETARIAMSWKNTTDRYGSMSIGMHWVMLLLLIAVYALINLRELYPRGSDPREAMKMWHYMAGLSVLMLVFARLAIRAAGQTPRLNPEARAWQHRLATSTHFALYLFMIVMPLLGWLNLSASGKPILLLGWQLPSLVDANEGLAAQVKEIHETIGTVGYYLIGLHAAAALFHHYVLRDKTLVRMLPHANKP